MPPESPRRKLLIRSVAVAALVASAAYLTWRMAATLDPSGWIVMFPLLFFEIHHAGGVALFTFALWDVDPVPGWRRIETTDLRVAVLIPTYDEPEEVLLPAVAAAISIGPHHETWVLDDGDRASVAALAEALGARYLSRAENTDAKAGNINNALGLIEADLVAVIDADHVLQPDFLYHTLGYFDDPQIAVVQTPQDFYNVESFEHEVRRGKRFNEQSVFYRVILPAKNRWNAAFWCGTNAVVRVEALREVGGVATGTVTEDIHTSIRLHRKGWRIVAHNEVLALGLAATDVNQYLLQRRRWARGAMQVMKMEHPITGPGLSPAQRLAYASTLFGWFDSWRSLGYALLPMAVLATGALPIRAPFHVFGPAFLATFILQFMAFRLLARGHYPPLLSTIFETLRMQAVLPATLELVHDGDRRFRVTPKGRIDPGEHRIEAPRLLQALVALGLASVVWFALTLAGLTPLHYGVPGVAYAAAGFLTINLSLLALALRRAMAKRFAGERRASVRFSLDSAATLNGVEARLEDASLGGARLLLAEAPPGLVVGEQVLLNIDDCGVQLASRISRLDQRGTDGVDCGVAFEPLQQVDVALLALWLFHGVAQDAMVSARAA